MENVLNLIRAERERQNKKWGEQNHDDYRSTTSEVSASEAESKPATTQVM